MTLFFGTDLLRSLYRKVEFKLVTACLEGRRSHNRRSFGLYRPYSRLHTICLQCERAWQNMSRVFASILAKSVAHIPRQEVTLLYTLYRIPLSLAMLSRKEVLTVGIDTALEVRNARVAGSSQVIKTALLFTTHSNRRSSAHPLTFQGIRQNQQHLLIAVSSTARVAKDGTMGE